jgi:hypothetical protein
MEFMLESVRIPSELGMSIRKRRIPASEDPCVCRAQLGFLHRANVVRPCADGASSFFMSLEALAMLFGGTLMVEGLPESASKST